HYGSGIARFDDRIGVLRHGHHLSGGSRPEIRGVGLIPKFPILDRARVTGGDAGDKILPVLLVRRRITGAVGVAWTGTGWVRRRPSWRPAERIDQIYPVRVREADQIVQVRPVVNTLGGVYVRPAHMRVYVPCPKSPEAN